MKLTFLAAAISLTLATGVSADPSSSAAEPHGLVENGIVINGAYFNGAYFNGRTFNGIVINGAYFNGFRVNGMRFNGLTLQGRSVATDHSQTSNPFIGLDKAPLGQ